MERGRLVVYWGNRKLWKGIIASEYLVRYWRWWCWWMSWGFMVIALASGTLHVEGLKARDVRVARKGLYQIRRCFVLRSWDNAELQFLSCRVIGTGLVAGRKYLILTGRILSGARLRMRSRVDREVLFWRVRSFVYLTLLLFLVEWRNHANGTRFELGWFSGWSNWWCWMCASTLAELGFPSFLVWNVTWGSRYSGGALWCRLRRRCRGFCSLENKHV